MDRAWLRRRAAGGNAIGGILARSVAWFDPTNPASITASSGSVSQWGDALGRSVNAVQATSGQQPTTGENTINGLNTISFHGNASNQFLKILGLVTQAQTVVAVWEHIGTTYTDWEGFIAASPAGRGSVKVPAAAFASGGTGDLSAPTGVCNVGQTTSACFLDGVAGSAANFDNFAVGLPMVPITSPHLLILNSINASPGSQNYCIGADPFGAVGTRHMNGNFGDVMVFDDLLNSADRDVLTMFLKSKWAIP